VPGSQTVQLCERQAPEHYKAPCSFRWIIVAESTVRWFVVREKHCWMAVDSADPAKQTGCFIITKVGDLDSTLECYFSSFTIVEMTNLDARTDFMKVG
jgi:hypothetical protein